MTSFPLSLNSHTRTNPFPFQRSNQPQYQKEPLVMLPHACDSGPVCSDFVTNGCILNYLNSRNLTSAVRLAAGSGQEDVASLLLELLFLLVSGSSITERILVRLAEFEQTEPDVWLRDDIRIAWLTVLYCANGRPTPWEWAFNRVIGGHPENVIPQLVERVQKHAQLGLPPKKSPQVVTKQSKEAAYGD